MKTCMLGLTLAISVLFTVPASAAGGGGWPPMVGPSQPYPSYCQYCLPIWRYSAARACGGRSRIASRRAATLPPSERRANSRWPRP